jgi:hypothetical protein
VTLHLHFSKSSKNTPAAHGEAELAGRASRTARLYQIVSSHSIASRELLGRSRQSRDAADPCEGESETHLPCHPCLPFPLCFPVGFAPLRTPWRRGFPPPKRKKQDSL